MCRSAVEAAFRDNVTDEQCRQAGVRQRHHFGFDFADRIEAAHAPVNGFLDRNAYDAATRIRLRGKKTLHGDPGITQDAIGTIKDALLVVDTLSRLPESRAH
jgi:hypothetical protein